MSFTGLSARIQSKIMRSINFFGNAIRKYYTSSADPNLRVGGSGVLPALKSMLYSGRHPKFIFSELSKPTRLSCSNLSLTESIEALYFISRINREYGGISQPATVSALFGRIYRQIGGGSRSDLIRCLQVCSLAANRNKIKQGDVAYIEMRDVRDELADRCIGGLSGKLSDLPCSSLSLLISAISRQYRPSFASLLEEVGKEICFRIQSSLTVDCTSSISAFRFRSDLERLIPYYLLANLQIGLQCKPDLISSSLDLFEKFKHEIPYNYLTLYIYAIPCGFDEQIRELLQYMLQVSEDDLTLMDFCRLCLRSQSSSSHEFFLTKLSAVIRSRPSSEFTIHFLKEVVCCIVRLDEGVKERYYQELIACEALPAPYAIDILQGISRDQGADHGQYVSRQVMKKINRMNEDDLQELIRHLENTRLRVNVAVRNRALSAARTRLKCFV